MERTSSDLRVHAYLGEMQDKSKAAHGRFVSIEETLKGKLQ